MKRALATERQETNQNRLQKKKTSKKNNAEKMESGFSFEKLTSENFHIWQYQMKALLITKGIGKALDEKDHKDSEKAQAIMSLCVSKEYVTVVASCSSAHEAWKTLNEMHEGQTMARRLSLRKQLSKLTKKKDENILEYIMRAKEICSDLKAIDGSVTETQLIDAVLDGLPEEYATTVNVLATLGETSMLKIQNHLLQAENNISEKEENSEQVALLTKNQRARKFCDHCQKPGHTKETCWKIHGLPPSMLKYIKKKDENEEHVVVVSYGLNCGSSEDLRKSWIVDSGATTHVCSDRSLFLSFEDLENSQAIMVGNGEKVLAKRKGKVQLSGKVILQNVLFCPDLHVNLISVPKLIENGCTTYFENDGCAIWKGKQKLIHAQQTNGLYVFPSVLHISCSALEWHRRLGHFGQMEKLYNQVTGIPQCDCVNVKECITCIQAKQGRKPIPKGNPENNADVGELLHLDLIGPVTPAGKSGEKYILTLLDEKSKIGFAKPLREKSQASKVIESVIKLMETSSKSRVKRIRSDRGTEFVNQELRTFLKEKGIVHETSAPYIPQQNGNAERFNRTLMEKVRAMFLDSGLEKRFWPFAVEYAAYVRNRIPCKPHGHTPFEMLFGSKPDLKNVRIFGQKCFVLKNPYETTGKLDSKSKPGIFLGIEPGSKDTCKIWCDGKVVLSRNVHFLTHQSDVVEEPSVEKSNNQLDVLADVEEEEQSVVDANDEDENHTPLTPGGTDRYPRRERRPPQEFWQVHACITEPLDVEEALSSPQKTDWKIALEEEIASLYQQDVFEIVDKHPNCKVLPSKWVFKIKYDQQGNIQRFKARLVAKGFKQIAGIDFNETFAPVARQSTLRMLLTLAAVKDWEVENIDIKTAFLNGILEEDIFMEMPPGFCVEGKVWKLKKTLYGLKQAPRAWHTKLTEVLTELQFHCSAADPGLYVAKDIFLMVYVDDLLLCGKSQEIVQKLKTSLLNTFEGRDLGATDTFLGIKIIRDRLKKEIFLSQEQYVRNMLERFRMQDCL